MLIKEHQKQFGNKSIVLPADKNFFVIVGANNSGKSTFLREVIKTNNEDSYLVSVNRTSLTGEGALDKNYTKNMSSYLAKLVQQEDDNQISQTQPLQDFFNLKDKEREPIISWYNKYFPNEITEEREDSDNQASSMQLKINSHSITKQGSGMRATLEIFIKLLDPKIKILCIDEPEMGLEPKLQKYLFQAIKDRASEHKKIIVSTHSHHFIDTDEKYNNYVCYRNSSDDICLKPVDDLKNVIFRLLGNTLSSFLLPENILIFEGPSDTTYLNKCLTLLDKTQYGVHNSGGNGNVKYAINSITNFLKFNEKNLPVYKNNTFVIVDNPRKDTIVLEWKRLLGADEKLLVLSKDAIEYYYPEYILKDIFSTTDNIDEIAKGYLSKNPNSYNGITISKTKLATAVCEKIKTEDLNDDTNELFTFLKNLP